MARSCRHRWPSGLHFDLLRVADQRADLAGLGRRLRLGPALGADRAASAGDEHLHCLCLVGPLHPGPFPPLAGGRGHLLHVRLGLPRHGKMGRLLPRRRGPRRFREPSPLCISHGAHCDLRGLRHRLPVQVDRYHFQLSRKSLVPGHEHWQQGPDVDAFRRNPLQQVPRSHCEHAGKHALLLPPPSSCHGWPRRFRQRKWRHVQATG
mmetsp:Transcript_36301/g.83723  ORF Transcript_36301/g.83723 Transcript_36301/m.83723 type:complete len:207 (-) Transcript_36301:138-758(-)